MDSPSLDPRRTTTDPDPNASITCTRCQAPLGVNDKRCPFCGALQPEHVLGGVQPPRFEPAEIGITAQSQAKYNRPLVVVKARPKGPSPVAMLGGLVLLGGASYGAWSYYQAQHPPPAPSAPARPPPLPPVISSVSGLAIPDAPQADPTLLLPKIQRALFPDGEAGKLVRIQVNGSTRGSVDLTQSGPSITYTYTLPSAADPKNPRAPAALTSYTLQAQQGGPRPVTSARPEAPVPEPNCIWSAAWRAAVKSGIPQDAAVDGVYEKVGNDPRWRITVPGKPEWTREMDGMSCALKPH
jgi:hypothetical protein